MKGFKILFIILTFIFFKKLRIALNLIIENKKIFIIIKNFIALNDLGLKIKIVEIFDEAEIAKVFRKINVNLSF